MEQLAAYGHAIVAMAATVLIGMALNPISAAKKSAQGVTSGAMPQPDYGDPVYRWSRTYQNLSEMMGFFAGATLAAILAGASPFWVNLLAATFFASRLVVAVVHIRGWGRPNSGLRTIVFAIGWLCCILLSIFAIVEVFS